MEKLKGQKEQNRIYSGERISAQKGTIPIITLIAMISIIILIILTNILTIIPLITIIL